MEELRSSATKGRWWQIGAAWSGDPLVEAKASGALSLTPKTPSDAKWAKLARKQGMNTDVRKAIFVALMGSEVRLHPTDLVGNADSERRTTLMPVIAFCKSV